MNRTRTCASIPRIQLCWRSGRLTPLTPLRSAPLWGSVGRDSPKPCVKAEPKMGAARRGDEGLRRQRAVARTCELVNQSPSRCFKMRLLWREQQHTTPTPLAPFACIPERHLHLHAHAGAVQVSGGTPGVYRARSCLWQSPGEGEDLKDGRGRPSRPLPSLYLFTPLSASVRRAVRVTSSGEGGRGVRLTAPRARSHAAAPIGRACSRHSLPARSIHKPCGLPALCRRHRRTGWGRFGRVIRGGLCGSTRTRCQARRHPSHRPQLAGA